MRSQQRIVFDVLFWTGIASVLSLMLVYPFGYDQYVFMVGGEKLVQQGAIPFRDVMDTKPMLIMYIYGWASDMWGHAMYSIRIFDALYHVISLFLFFHLLRKYFLNESLAYLTVGIYALLYVSTGPASTAQAESFALLPTLGILFTIGKIEETRKIRDVILLFFLTCICAFTLFTLKITLIIIPFALCTWMIVDKAKKRKLHVLHFSGMVVGLITFITCLVVWLSANRALSFAKEYFTWLSEYKSHSDTLNSITIYKDYYLEFANKLTETTPLSILLFAAFGTFISITRGSSYWRNNRYMFFLIGFLASIVLMLFENKYILYQYGLFWWVFSPFAAVGIYIFVGWIFRFIRTGGKKVLRAISSIAILSILLFFSPFLPIFKHLDRNVNHSKAANNDVIDFFQLKVNAEQDLDTLESKLEPLLRPEDKIFLFGHHVGIYYKLNKLPTTMMFTSAFLTATWTPDSWKQAVIQGLNTNMPSYILVEMNDAIPITNNSTLDSREHFENWKEIANFTRSNYDAIDSTAKFIIYKRTP